MTAQPRTVARRMLAGRRARLRALAAVVAVAAATAASSAQAQYRGEVDVDAVVAPVTVRDAAGRLVTNVGRNRFHLYVDGIEVQIQDFSLESDLPMSLGFVLDTSGSMEGRKIASCRSLMTAFLEERRQEDELALWTFGNERVLERFPFGMGWYLLPRVLETVRPWSTTALYDMIRRIPDVMERARHPRRAAILLTDGVDNASEITAAQATAIAQGLDTPIFVLGVEPPPSGADGSTSYEEILRLIAEASGGRYQRIPEIRQMPEVARALLAELSSRYIITFATSGVGLSKYRTIEVKVDGYRATSRKGYTGTLP